MTRVALLGLGGAAERIHLPGLLKMQDVQIVAGAVNDVPDVVQRLTFESHEFSNRLVRLLLELLLLWVG